MSWSPDVPPTLDVPETESTLDELRRLVPRINEVRDGFERVAVTLDARTAADAALTLSGDVPEVRVFGTLDRVTDEECRALLSGAVTDERARAALTALFARMRATPRIHRALAHVHPYSFAPAGYDAWKRYRDGLRALRDEPIWGLPAQYRVPLGSIYVPHHYREEQAAGEGATRPSLARRSAKRGEEEAPAAIDPRPMLRSLATSVEGGLIFVVGSPGSGKSTLARMLASELAEDTLLQPVLIRLRGVRPEGDPLAEVERVLAESDGELAAVLRRAPRLVLLLDGFDELIQASRTGLGSFFLRLDALLRDQRVHAVVCFGRDTVFSREDTAFPARARVLRLLPFEDAQVAAWSDRWSKATGRRFEWKRYKKRDEHAGDEHDDALDALLHEPMTLRLLALLDLEGIALEGEDGELDLARVYHRVVHEVCERHEKERGDFSSRELRRLLRILGFAAVQAERELIHLDDLQRAMVALGVQVDAARSKSNATALIIEISQRTAEGVPQAWEFLHKTLGEYLAAEFLAAEIAQLVAEDEDEFGERHPRLGETQLAVRWIERFGPVVLSSGVERFLRRMGGDWRAFFDDGRVKAPERDFERLSVRLGTVYRRLLDEADGEVTVQTARAWSMRPGDVHGIALANVFLMAGLRFGDAVCFQPELQSPGRYADAYHAMRRSPAKRGWDRIGARTHFLGIAAGSDLSGFDLSYSVWREVVAEGLLFTLTRFSDVTIDRATFRGCKMAHVGFQRARVVDTRFEDCWLVHAVFERVDLTLVEFLRCQLLGTSFDDGIVCTPTRSLSTRRVGPLREVVQAADSWDETFTVTLDAPSPASASFAPGAIARSRPPS